MSAPTIPMIDPAPAEKKGRIRRERASNSLLAHGEPSIWATGGALAICLAMILGLLALIVIQGSATFWPSELVLIRTLDGKTYLGEITREETYEPEPSAFESLPEKDKAKVIQSVQDAGGTARRRLLRTGNFELTGSHHHWISDFEIAEESTPPWALVIERTEWGNFYGTPVAFISNGQATANGAEETWAAFNANHPAVVDRLRKRIDLELHGIGAVSRKEKAAKLAVRQAELNKDPAQIKAAKEKLAETLAWSTEETKRINGEIRSLNVQNDVLQVDFVTADGKEKILPLASIVRTYPANQLSFWDKVQVYFSRWGEFLTERPRASNTEGGVWPAIFGTIVLTLLLALAVVPFGVLAALYLREYAKSGPIISAVRIAINNLAGVPSIVFGVFGMGFFCLLCGKFIDKGPEGIEVTPLPPTSWWLGVAVTVGLGVAAFMLGLVGPRKSTESRTASYLSGGVMLFWLASLGLLAWLIVKSPFFTGFYQAHDNAVFGTGGILWASLTLALLTVPVVIVATEEALAAVPNSMREGSYACGASKWQTIYRIVLPRSMPGIMTGMILAMARGAGEVAPIMLVGASKFVPHLSLDFSDWSGSLGPIPTGPIHANRSFMHLGYHILDVGFQSPNSEAARPMLYTTTLLLIAVVAALTITAGWLRSRLRKRFLTSQF